MGEALSDLADRYRPFRAIANAKCFNLVLMQTLQVFKTCQVTDTREQIALAYAKIKAIVSMQSSVRTSAPSERNFGSYSCKKCKGSTLLDGINDIAEGLLHPEFRLEFLHFLFE